MRLCLRNDFKSILENTRIRCKSEGVPFLTECHLPLDVSDNVMLWFLTRITNQLPAIVFFFSFKQTTFLLSVVVPALLWLLEPQGYGFRCNPRW